MTSKVKCVICILYSSVARGVLALLCSWVWGLVRPFIGVLFLCLGCDFAAVLMLRVCVFVSWPCTLLFKDPCSFMARAWRRSWVLRVAMRMHVLSSCPWQAHPDMSATCPNHLCCCLLV
jgi:hypothetical protein